MEQEYETIDLREIFFLLKKNILKIIASMLVFGVCGFLVTEFLMTPKYQANATMIVNARQGQNNTNFTNDMLNTAKNLVNTYGVIVKSDTVLEPVIEELDLDMTYEQLAKEVLVSDVQATQVMQISVQHEDPNQAKAIVAKIVEIAPDVIQDAVEAGSVKVVSEARVQPSPVSPSKARNTALAAVLGVVLSVGAIVLKEFLNNTFKTEEDVQKHLGYTVLGVIPYVEGEE